MTGEVVVQEAAAAGNTTVVVVKQGGNGIGIASLVFGVLSIFVLALLFVPLGLLCGIIAIVRKQILFGAIGIVTSLVGAFLSPAFWLLFASLGLTVSR